MGRERIREMTTIAYLRVSTLKQDIENQTHEIKRYCEKQKLEVNQWLKVEMSSRKSTKERRIDELMAQLRKGDTLIVSELSRLGRSLSEVVVLVEKIIKMKVKLIAIKQNLILNGSLDPMTKAMVGLFSIFAEMERDMISIRTKNGLAAAKARGVKLGNPNLKAIHTKRQESAKAFAESLRPTLEAYKAAGMTQRQMVEALNGANIPARKGGKWGLSQLQRVLGKLQEI